MADGFSFNPDLSSDEDLLGFDQYIHTLSGMIRDPNFKTPFCIGIYGKWGMGKTSFMQLLAKAVSQDGEPPPCDSGLVQSMALSKGRSPYRPIPEDD